MLRGCLASIGLCSSASTSFRSNTSSQYDWSFDCMLSFSCTWLAAALGNPRWLQHIRNMRSSAIHFCLLAMIKYVLWHAFVDYTRLVYRSIVAYKAGCESILQLTLHPSFTPLHLISVHCFFLFTLHYRRSSYHSRYRSVATASLTANYSSCSVRRFFGSSSISLGFTVWEEHTHDMNKPLPCTNHNGVRIIVETMW